MAQLLGQAEWIGLWVFWVFWLFGHTLQRIYSIKIIIKRNVYTAAVQI